MTMKAPAALLPAPFTGSMMKSRGQTRTARSRSRCIVGLRPATRASALPDLGADPIDHLLALDPGGRGIGRFFQPGGARRAADTLRRARRVLVTTGVRGGAGAGGAGGPPGAGGGGGGVRARGAPGRGGARGGTPPPCGAPPAPRRVA